MRIFVFIFLSLIVKPITASNIIYEIKMPIPQSHYFEVSMTITDYNKDFFDVQMPVWAPGSYLIREFSKNVEELKAISENNEILTKQLNKNTWRIFSKNANKIIIRYKVYAFEMSVRHSFLDASHGYFNGSSVFMFIDELKNQPATLIIIPFKDWKKVSTSLKRATTTSFKYEIPNYDVLVDSPVEIGNHETFTFIGAGIPHHVALYGKGNFNIETLKVDMAKIVEAATDVFGENPNKEYTFIIHNLTKGSGGLEHSSSCNLQVNRWTYTGEDYKGFLTLVAHEYFHLWNVKRIRPIELGPFDYNNENYTDLLWVMEGFTSYYDELLLYRTGFYTEEDIIKKLTGAISSIENQPGNNVMSVAESSFNAWTKGYRPNENSYNSSVSYYTKGSVIANMLDIMIAESTNGKKSLDDAMKYLYDEYYKKQNRGFNMDEMKDVLEKISGLNLNSFFENYVTGTESFDYNTIFNGVNYGVKTHEKKRLGLGIVTNNNLIKNITRNTAAYHGGLNVGDEILAINGYRVNNNVNDFLNDINIGDNISVLISRDDIIQTFVFPFIEYNYKNFVITKNSPTINEATKKWLRKL